MAEIDIKYTDAAPLRMTQCRAWLIEYGAGGKDVLLTAAEMLPEDVVTMLKVHTHDDFTIANITVGCFPIHPDWSKSDGEIPAHLNDEFYSTYFNDARKIDRDGMVQL